MTYCQIKGVVADDFCLRCSKKHNCPEGRKSLKKIQLLSAAFFRRIFGD